MNAFYQVLESFPTLLLTVWVETRFLSRTLGRRFSALATILCILMARVLAGWLNINYQIVGTIPSNLFYYGLLSFLLFLLLFRGGLVKIGFFVTLLTCIPDIFMQIVIPFLFYTNNIWNTRILDGFGTVGVLVFLSVFLEFAARRFHNLRYELPNGYTIYLMVVVIFVHLAVYAMFEWTRFMRDGEMTIPLAVGCSLFAVAGLAVTMVATFALDRQVVARLREQQYALQAAHLKSQEMQWRQMAGFRHDLKNHLLCLEGLLAQGKPEQAQAYMQTLSQTTARLESLVQTGNDYGDALLNAKYAEAEALGIQLSFDMALPAQGYAGPEDLCCILSNGMDNAIEACARIPQTEKRWISARSFLARGQLVIEIKNALPEGVTVKNGQVHSHNHGPGHDRGAGHGLGLMNLRAAVEKYGGVLDLSAEGCFTLSVLLPPTVHDKE